ncbi:unnamed protein product [Hydatigera taeniaeformis]|uniref:GPS domain-containing protein n=1 Tax=Hydatigena taeniaeformis TaxID=6205 RepID=A0A0R3X9W0_HYDTA|nr:unnamed protein product [Hydatigera taeniaeformis]
MILSTGPDVYQGLSIFIQFLRNSNVYHLLVRLVTPDSTYQVFATDFAESDEWVNVGIVVAGAKTSAGVCVEVYKNGHALMATSLPILRDFSNRYGANPSPGIYLGSAITTMSNMSTASIASGTISSLVFWSKRVASCSSPRSSYMTLRGNCFSNESLPEKTTCQDAPNCQLSQNGVCLDTTVENIYAMAKGAHLISSPKALLSLLEIVLAFLKNDTEKYYLEYEKRILWSSVVLFNRLSVVEEANAFEVESLRSKTDTILAFLLDYLEALFLTRFSKSWSELCGSFSSKPPEIVATLSTMIKVLLTDDRPVIESSLGRNYLAGYIELTIPSALNNDVPVKVINPSLIRQSGSTNLLGTLTVSVLSASTSAITLDVLSVPKEFELSENHSLSLGDGKRKSEVILALINSPIMTTSLVPTSEQQDESGAVFLYTLALIRPNEFSASAEARRSDALHWKARRVEEEGLGALEYAVKCVFWDDSDIGAEGWKAHYCDVAEAHLSYVVCRCNRTGSLAVAMEYTEDDKPFWRMAGSSSLQAYRTAKLAINLTGNLLSITALTALAAYLCRKNTLPELLDQTKIKLHFVASLLCYHISFVLFPLLEGSEMGCCAVGLLEHFFSSTSLAWQCCNNFYTFNALINGDTRARIKLSIFVGWVTNAVIVAVIGCATSASEYGLGLMCLPTAISGYIATAECGLFLLVSLISCIILLCNIDAPAYLNPRVIEALQNDMRTTTAASIYSALVYGLGIVFVFFNLPYSAFAFWILNSLTGCMVALLLGPLDKSNVVKKRKSSGALEVAKTSRSSVYAFDNSEDLPSPSGAANPEGIESYELHSPHSKVDDSIFADKRNNEYTK